jgi:rubredoxin
MPLFEVDQIFVDEETCWHFLERTRWPDGEVCPKCGSIGEGSRVRSRPAHYWRCGNCGRLFHAALGTAMEGSHLPLHTWFRAIHLLDETPDLSTVELGRFLDIRQKTAWLLVQRLRAMTSKDPSLLRAIAGAVRSPTARARRAPRRAVTLASGDAG